MVYGNACSSSLAAEIENRRFFFKNIKYLIWKPLQLPGDNEMLPRFCAQGSTELHSMHTSFCQKIYGDAMNCVELSHIGTVFLYGNLAVLVPSFTGTLRFCTDWAVTSLKANAVVNCLFHVVLLNLTLEFCQFFMGRMQAFWVATRIKKSRY